MPERRSECDSVSGRPRDSSAVNPVRAAVDRAQIADAAARGVLAAAARRLSDAIAEFEGGLDRKLPMTDLQIFDAEVAAAEESHRQAQRDAATAAAQLSAARAGMDEGSAGEATADAVEQSSEDVDPDHRP